MKAGDARKWTLKQVQGDGPSQTCYIRSMMVLKSIALALVASTAFACPAQARVSPAKIDSAARAAMERTGARGLAMAVIEDGRPVFVRAWGHRNSAGDPLGTDSIMYGASLTKAVFAYTVMQLVDEGRLDLDRPVAEYLPRPLPEYGNLDAYGNWGDLAGDERWRRLTARHLLTHSSGFRNFSWDEPDQKLRINFEPGARYAYSGEGIILLQFVIEKGLGLDLGAEMKRRVFDSLGMKNTSMTWRPDFARNLADGWTKDGKVEPHDERSRVRAAGSMDTTISDFARFAAAFMRGDGLKRSSRAEMLKPLLPIASVSQFPSMAPDAPPGKRWKGLAAGLGVVTFEGPQGRGFFKGGHNDSTGNSWVCLEQGRRCVVLLANDVRAEAAFPELVESVLGDTGLPWRWEYSWLPE
jgi:CubicO group peptidase (beta-lactamase class C family)